MANLITEAVEEWKNGTGDAGTSAGADVMYFAAGGINRNATFGLGIWNAMIWATNKSGAACDNAKCSSDAGGTFTDAAASGAGPDDLNRMN